MWFADDDHRSHSHGPSLANSVLKGNDRFTCTDNRYDSPEITTRAVCNTASTSMQVPLYGQWQNTLLIPRVHPWSRRLTAAEQHG
jgi:hypothetical protein